MGVFYVIQERFNKGETSSSLDLADFLLFRILYMIENFEEKGIGLFVTHTIEILLILHQFVIAILFMWQSLNAKSIFLIGFSQ